MKSNSKQNGFGLLEVLIAFVIITVSVVALLSLQNSYLKNENNLTIRNGAMHLAESKLDDLRTFDSLASATGVVAYNDINNNTGGTITAGTVSVGSYSYTLSWTVSNQFLTTPANTYPELKNITVSVSWKNHDGYTESLALNGIITRAVSVDSSQLTNSSVNSGYKPKITYTPGQAPDVISMDLGNGSKQETTKPLPTVSNSGGSVQVKFNTVTYDSSTKTQVLSDFETLSCTCTNNGNTASTLLPGKPIQLDSGLLYWQLGSLLSKKTAVKANNQQPTLCTVCCSNHFDGSTSQGVSFPYYYNQLNQAAAKYSFNGTTYSAVTSGDFIDSCRLIRVDGYYKPLPDWNLVKLVVMSSAFLTDTQNLAKYQAYVNYVVGEYIKLQKAMNWSTSSNNIIALNTSSIADFSTWLTTTYGTNTNITTTLGSTPTQLISRGIFVDILDKNTSWLSTIDTTQTGYLAKVPFYDINMTLLTQWSSANTTIARVASDPIRSLDSTDPDYYGVYRRGYATPVAAGSTTITAAAYQGNSSVAAYQYNKNAAEAAISSFDSTNGKSGSVSLTVSGTSSGITINGKIYCYNQQTKTTGQNTTTSLIDCVQGQTDYLANLQISSSGASCALGTEGTTGSGSAKYSYRLYTCNVAALPATDATVTISSIPSGFTISPTSNSLSYPVGTASPIDGHCFNIYNSSINLNTLPLPTTCP